MTKNERVPSGESAMFSRREFLKRCGGLLVSVVAIPVPVFVPPREPFVRIGTGLDNLYSHLGVLPVSRELSTCEGRLLEIGEWDGTGFPCLVQNACTFGPEPPRAWLYDFDLWNFRHDDDLIERMGRESFRAEMQRHGNWATWNARRRFGSDLEQVVAAGGGPMTRWIIPAGI